MVAISKGKESPIWIQLDHHSHTYGPGQQCSGRILVAIMKTAIDSTLRIALLGRVRTVVSSASGQLESQFENVRNFIEVAATLHEGHYIRESGEVAYEFNLTVPTHTKELVDQLEFSDPAWLTPLRNAPIPSSARFTDSVVGRSWSADIEYMLAAKVVSPGDQVNTTTLPITIHAGPAHRLRDLHDPSQTTAATAEISIRSWKLLPESHHSPTTIRQRTASLFRLPSLPMFTFEADITYPRVLQLGNPQKVPFIVSVTAVTSLDKTSIVPSALSFYRYPSVAIESVTVELHTTTTVQYPTLIKTASVTKLSRLTILQKKYLSHRLVVRSLAWDQKAEPSEDTSSVDIGKLCGMVLPLPDPSSLGKTLEGRAISDIHNVLSASFKSPTLTHTHALTWAITVVCASERCNIRSKTPQPIQVVEGPLLATKPGEQQVPMTPAPAYSKYPRPSRASLAAEDGFGEAEDSTGLATSASVQHIMHVSKAAAEAALCELPAYTEPMDGSFAYTTCAGNQQAIFAGNKKTLKPPKR